MNSIENLIIESLKDVIDLVCVNEPNGESKSNLVFPLKRDGKTRVSEQEAKFLFMQRVEKVGEFLYSIEAPTSETYKFSGQNKRSGNIDVCLYRKSDKKRIHLVEFKALNPDQPSYSKDFEKLFWDEDGLTNYFIQLLENTDSGTIPNIVKKYNEAIKEAKGKELADFKSCLTIFLCDLGKKWILKYNVEKTGELSEPIFIDK
jgi:hypothetical protein